MKGISIELPFLRFKYVKYSGCEGQARSQGAGRLEAASEEYERPATVSSQVTFRQEAAFTSLGMDPLVSFASVVHELSYGRITPVGGVGLRGTYPRAVEPSPYSLDMLV
jgi:hypothetical protein